MVGRSFLRQVKRALPFPIQQLQSDNGSEFALEFPLAVQAAGIRHRPLHPLRDSRLTYYINYI